MRPCRHCPHQNADHLSYCSQCGRRLGPVTGEVLGATLPTMLPTPTGLASLGKALPGRAPPGKTPPGKTPPPKTSVVSWMSGSIGYIYVYLRGKLDAGERRRRLIEERDGANRLLAGATKELGTTILREGIQQSDLTGLLEAIGRAEAQRESALADITASERLQAAEDARLGAQETALEAELAACSAAHREAEELLRTVSAESQSAGARLARIRDDQARLQREADTAANASEGPARAVQLRNQASALSAEQTGLKEQALRLETQLFDLRDRSASLRAATASARSKLDAAVATRRKAAFAMGATIAGHARDRTEAEREVGELTEQLGRAAAQVRPNVPLLLPLLQRIDRLRDTVAERGSEIAALDQASAHYDERKLLTGVGLVTSMIAVTIAVLWVVLR